MTKAQKEKLETLQKRWAWTSNLAKTDPVTYALQRSRREYLRVVGKELGLQKWQSEVLRRHDLAGFKTRLEERTRASSIVQDAFSNFPEQSIQRVLAEKVSQDIFGVVATVEATQTPKLITNPKHPAFIFPKPMFKNATTAVVAGVIMSGCVAPMTQPAMAYDYEWDRITSQSQSLENTSKETPDATRGMGIYIPKMVYPVGSSAPISSGFGYRSAPCTGCSSFHEGLDFNPGYGSPVYSATDGTVVFVGWEGSLGYHVVIQDAGTWKLSYGHMIGGSAPDGIAVGSRVQMGQQLGLVGSTGQSTGAHLHFAIQDGSVLVDPLPLLLKYAK